MSKTPFRLQQQTMRQLFTPEISFIHFERTTLKSIIKFVVVFLLTLILLHETCMRKKFRERKKKMRMRSALSWGTKRKLNMQKFVAEWILLWHKLTDSKIDAFISECNGIFLDCPVTRRNLLGIDPQKWKMIYSHEFDRKTRVQRAPNETENLL